MNTLEETIKHALKDILIRRGHSDPTLTGETRLFNDLGFDSFAFAELVVVLELDTGLDPFTQAGRVIPVQTISDLVTVYVDEEKRRRAS